MSTAATTGNKVLVITRVFDAPRELVFKMWTDPDHLKNWWGPKHHPATVLNMDVRQGGAWRNCLTSVETGDPLWHHGIFQEVIEPERLVFSFVWEEEGERGIENIVTITFEDVGGKTRMTLRQEPFISVGERDGHGEGWSSTFDRLEELLRSAS